MEKIQENGQFIRTLMALFNYNKNSKKMIESASDTQMVTKKVKTVSQRTDNSLHQLTQKFIKLIK